jgi:AAA ATPase domain/Protein of unknown function (DUF3696)
MALTRMRLKNYRCFKDTGDVELRPLTLVLGKNNSGKSALVRAPLVWSTGFRGESEEPLDLDLIQDLNVANSFVDLIYGRNPHGSISAEFTFDGEREFYVTVQNIDEERTQVVTDANILDIAPINFRTLAAQWDGGTGGSQRTYTIKIDGEEQTDLLVHFSGINPIYSSTQRGSIFHPKIHVSTIKDQISTRYNFMNNDFPEIRYIGPFRRQPEFDYRSPLRDPHDVGTAGQNAPGVLARNVFAATGGILNQLNQDIAPLLPGWEIEVVEEGARFSVWLSKPTENVKVNLADAGAGVAQVLPLFIQRALDTAGGGRPRRDVLEIIEQPELHLHPAAHADLADLYVKAVERDHARFLIETHSETMVLRLRRRIAEGRLSADKVAMYFVESIGEGSCVRRINIDDQGNLDSWPDGVFSEDYQELLGLTAAQDER